MADCNGEQRCCWTDGPERWLGSSSSSWLQELVCPRSGAWWQRSQCLVFNVNRGWGTFSQHYTGPGSTAVTTKLQKHVRIPSQIWRSLLRRCSAVMSSQAGGYASAAAPRQLLPFPRLFSPVMRWLRGVVHHPLTGLMWRSLDPGWCLGLQPATVPGPSLSPPPPPPPHLGERQLKPVVVRDFLYACCCCGFCFFACIGC